MIVWIPGGKKPTSGKAKFMERLSIALRDLNVKVVQSGDKRHDVSLHIGAVGSAKFSGKKVIRFDGVWHNIDQPFKKKNKLMTNIMMKADGIVYQTKFCRSLCDKYLGKFDGPSAVIMNGADISFYDVEPAVSKYKVNFFTSARWRPHKRLQDIIESFLLTDIDDSCLNIAGDLKLCGVKKDKLKKYFLNPRINYLGVICDKEIASWLKVSIAFIHISWIDWCPNGVVEAIAARKPVITNNIGGTRELVEPSGGIICDIDDIWNKKPCKLYQPPPIDRRVIADAITKISYSSFLTDISCSHVDINNIASQYLKFMKKILA